ncbi:MAG: NF038129 family PEP-CTERM protein [Candidatus Competibacteraceae bacterium]
MFFRAFTRSLCGLALVAGLAGVSIPMASATTLQVTLDSSALAGTSAQLAFDLTNGDGVTNNTVTITATGGVLSGTWTLSDTLFFNELLLPITLGNPPLSLTLTLTDNYDPSGSAPDQFALFLLDSTASTPLFGTSDPTGANALFVVDLGVAGGLQSYQATDIPSPATWTVINAAIPEPSVLLLFATGLLGLICRRWC